MSRLHRFAALAALVIASLFAPPAQAGPATYNLTVAATSTNSVVTPTASLGQPMGLTVINDGSVPVYFRLDGVAVAAATTAYKLAGCESIRVTTQGYGGFTTIGVITDAGNTASVRISVNYLGGAPDPTAGPYPTSQERYIRNPTGCGTSNTASSTVNGASWAQYSDSELLTLATGGLTTDTTGNLLHANSLIWAVTAFQTTNITVATNWGLSDTTTANRFAAATAIATRSLVGIVQWSGAITTLAAGPSQAAAAVVRVTATGSNPATGVVRITVFGATAAAPTT